MAATAALARPEYFPFSRVGIFLKDFQRLIKVAKSCDFRVLFIKIRVAFSVASQLIICILVCRNIANLLHLRYWPPHVAESVSLEPTETTNVTGSLPAVFFPSWANTQLAWAKLWAVPERECCHWHRQPNLTSPLFKSFTCLPLQRATSVKTSLFLTEARRVGLFLLAWQQCTRAQDRREALSCRWDALQRSNPNVTRSEDFTGGVWSRIKLLYEALSQAQFRRAWRWVP